MPFVFNKPRIGKGSSDDQIKQINIFLELLIPALERHFNTVERMGSIVESGSRMGWSYRKYRDGTFDMFGTFDLSAPLSSQAGPLYKSTEIEIYLPFSVIDAGVTGNVSGDCWIANAHLAKNDAIIFNIFSYRYISGIGDIRVNLHICGKYLSQNGGIS